MCSLWEKLNIVEGPEKFLYQKSQVCNFSESLKRSATATLSFQSIWKSYKMKMSNPPSEFCSFLKRLKNVCSIPGT